MTVLPNKKIISICFYIFIKCCIHFYAKVLKITWLEKMFGLLKKLSELSIDYFSNVIHVHVLIPVIRESILNISIIVIPYIIP